jgi:hypothetical protein
MDLFDPTQRQLPPPRHQLESDSEEDSDPETEEIQGTSKLASGSDSKSSKSRLTRKSGAEPLKIDTVVVGSQLQDVPSHGEGTASAVIFDGEAGESLLRGLRISDASRSARGEAAAEESSAAQTVELRVDGVPVSISSVSDRRAEHRLKRFTPSAAMRFFTI